MTTTKTAILSQGEVERKAAATYGNGDVLLRIGNGGAGATGLIEALALNFLLGSKRLGSIEWICNHSRNTQLALANGYIDVGLTYERDQEALAAAEGWSATAGCVFHDHFVLAGPVSDPAGIRHALSVPEALEAIAAKRAEFHSRRDRSATMWKEERLWAACRLRPWESEVDAEWYKTSVATPAEALRGADAAGAYLLTDRSTVLRQTALQTIHSTTVFFEPKSPDDILMNSCYAIYSPLNRTELATSFVRYLMSDRGQRVVGSFGVDQCGLPLFATIAEGYAKTKLVGGRPKAGKWMAVCGL